MLKSINGFIARELSLKHLSTAQFIGIQKAMKKYASHYHEEKSKHIKKHLKAETFSIIKRGDKWAVVKHGNERASVICDKREEAFHQARTINSNAMVIVCSKDGSVDFISRPTKK